MAGTMDKLAPELFKMVMQEVAELQYDDHISRGNLCNLRLVNHFFAAYIAPTLFYTIPLWVGIKSLQNLTDLRSILNCKQCFPLVLSFPFWRPPKLSSLGCSQIIQLEMERVCNVTTSSLLNLAAHALGSWIVRGLLTLGQVSSCEKDRILPVEICE